MKTKTLLAAALTATFGYGTSAYAGIIDLFDDPSSDPWQVVTATQSTPTDFNEFGSSTTIIGGHRDLVANFISGGSLGNTVLGVADGLLNFSNSSNVIGVGIVQWDGDDDSDSLDPDGLGGLSLVNQEGCPITGCDRFVAIVNFADLGFGYSIGVYTDASNYSILTAVSQGANSPVSADYLFEWFTRSSGSYNEGGLPFNILQVGTGPDFASVGALELVLNPAGVVIGGQAFPQTISVDLEIDSIRKTGIPEPGMLALMGVGLLAGGLAGRRRQAHKA